MRISRHRWRERAAGLLVEAEQTQGLQAVCAAVVRLGLEAGAGAGTFWTSPEAATVGGVEVDAADACGLASRHAGQG